MTKPAQPSIAGPLIELPPLDEADAWARAARVLNWELFLDSRNIPAGLDNERLREICAELDALAIDVDLFMTDWALSGEADRPRFRAIQARQGALRREFLVMIGADSDSDDLFERPVELNHS